MFFVFRWLITILIRKLAINSTAASELWKYTKLFGVPCTLLWWHPSSCARRRPSSWAARGERICLEERGVCYCEQGFMKACFDSPGCLSWDLKGGPPVCTGTQGCVMSRPDGGILVRAVWMININYKCVEHVGKLLSLFIVFWRRLCVFYKL